jgi:plastocyanin
MPCPTPHSAAPLRDKGDLIRPEASSGLRVFGVLLLLSLPGSFERAILGQSAADLHGTAHVGDGPAKDAVVWLEAPYARPPAGGPAAPRAVLDQRNLTFSPHVLVVRVGTTVDFPNNDRVFHNVFSFRDGKRFDLGVYPVGALRHVLFDQPGLSRIFCNIHPHMAAYVMAVDSPYFARTDQSGAFTIAAVPAGNYTYHAWRPGAAAELSGKWSSTDGSLRVGWP